MTLTLHTALTDPGLPVGTMLPVRAEDIPAPFRREQQYKAERGWSEVYSPAGSNPDACRFGCKIYARRVGCTVRWAVLHSLTYGHSHSPNAR